MSDSAHRHTGTDDGHGAASLAAVEDPRVTAALQEYLSDLEAGRRPDRAALLARHPDLAPTLAEALDGLDFLYGVVPSGGRKVLEPFDPFSLPEGRTAPARLGDFRILREVGRGGMGVVYEAEQLSLGRRVALKVLPFAAALDPRQLQRFKTEAQAAAHLHHSNIVPVYAVGCERGVHFYAMQFIDGQTLAQLIRSERERTEDRGQRTEKADSSLSSVLCPLSSDVPGPLSSGQTTASTSPRAALTTSLPQRGPEYFKALARLGVQAAEALEYAHQTGVVHRDVKPANLLVDGRGHLWINDFGLAQVHGGGELTATGDVLGTVRYMSPEQAEGRRGVVDHRTDIYSLGVSLYELFTLHFPYPARERGELLRKILHEEPTPPRRARRGLPWELETVLLKCLAKDPAERYATAQELADDLRRFVEDQPVLARRPTPVQVASKWMRRHQGVVWTVGVVLLLAVAGLAVVAEALHRSKNLAQQSERRAKEGFAAARRAVDALYIQFTEKMVSKDPGLLSAQREFLERAKDVYARIAAEEGDEAENHFERARALKRLGDIEQNLGRLDASRRAYDEAMGVLEKLLADSPRSVEYRDELANCLNSRGRLGWWTARYDEAIRNFQKAIDVRRQLVQERPADPSQRLKLSAHYSNLGGIHLSVMRIDEARQCFTTAQAEAEAIIRATPEGQKPDPDVLDRLAITHHNIGVAYQQVERPDQAEQHWNKCREIFGQLARDYPDNVHYQEYLASSKYILGVQRYDSGRLADARKLLVEARQDYRKLLDDYPKVADYRAGYARSTHCLGRTVRDLNQLAEAKSLLEEALPRSEALTREKPEVGLFREELLRLRIDLANLLMVCGRAEESVAVSRRAWAEAFEDPATKLPATPQAELHRLKLRNNMADHAQGLGRSGDAEKWFREAAAVGEALTAKYPQVPTYRTHLVSVYLNLGYLLRSLNRLADAEAAYRASLAHADKLAAASPPVPRALSHRAWAAVRLGRLCEQQGRTDEAKNLYASAVKSVRAMLDQFPDSREALLYAAWFFAAGHDPASRDLGLAMELAERLEKDEPDNPEVWRVKGLVRFRQGDGPAALRALAKAQELFRGRDRVTDLLLALAHDQAGDRAAARREYDRACGQIARAHEFGDELDRFRAEADEHFGKP